jgi:hypothetical protein
MRETQVATGGRKSRDRVVEQASDFQTVESWDSEDVEPRRVKISTLAI